MGIPVYFKTLISQYQDDILVKAHLSGIQTLCLDLNCLIALELFQTNISSFAKSHAGFAVCRADRSMMFWRCCAYDQKPLLH